MEKCILILCVIVVAVDIIIIHYDTYSPDIINDYRVHTSGEELPVKLRKLDVLQETSSGVHSLWLIMFSFDNVSTPGTAAEPGWW